MKLIFGFFKSVLLSLYCMQASGASLCSDELDRPGLERRYMNHLQVIFDVTRSKQSVRDYAEEIGNGSLEEGLDLLFPGRGLGLGRLSDPMGYVGPYEFDRVSRRFIEKIVDVRKLLNLGQTLLADAFVRLSPSSFKIVEKLMRLMTAKSIRPFKSSCRTQLFLAGVRLRFLHLFNS